MSQRRTVSILFGCLVSVAVGVGWLRSPRSEAFNATAWAAAKPPDYAPRYQMVQDVERLVREGKLNSTASVSAMLGTPDRQQTGYWMYNLGPEHRGLMRVDHDWLRLSFDEQGRLQECRVAPD